MVELSYLSCMEIRNCGGTETPRFCEYNAAKKIVAELRRPRFADTVLEENCGGIETPKIFGYCAGRKPWWNWDAQVLWILCCQITMVERRRPSRSVKSDMLWEHFFFKQERWTLSFNLYIFIKFNICFKLYPLFSIAMVRSFDN